MVRREGSLEGMGVKSDFWKNKKVLITGHTGFKGSWLSLWLHHLGTNLAGVSLNPPTTPNLFSQADVAGCMDDHRIDICDLHALKALFRKFQPEIVFHFAAQSLVRYSYGEPVETYMTNVIGTMNVLESIRSVGTVRSAVMVTTDKCYENQEWVWGYRENEAMGGHDLYSSSKGCAELLIASYRHSFFSKGDYHKHGLSIASARAGNVIGGGDWAEDRLIPDIIRAFNMDKPVQIRNPSSIRPWQHVLEPLAGYMVLSEMLFESGPEYAEAWNFGPYDEGAKPVEWIVRKMAEKWGSGASWTIDNGNHPHEATYLKLDCSKAHKRLQWRPKWSLEFALEKIIEWYRAETKGFDLKDICMAQIEEYMSTMDTGL